MWHWNKNLCSTKERADRRSTVKKWDFLDFPVGLPNLRGRKSGTSWVWKLMEALDPPAEFSEMPNSAYFYAYFCFCTCKISFRGFSFTLDIATGCPNWTSKMYRGLPKFLLSIEIDTRDVQKLSKSPPTFNKLYDVCPAYLLEICYLCWLSFKDVPLSACRSFIDIGVKRRGTLLMAVWSLCVFVTRAKLINWCLYN